MLPQEITKSVDEIKTPSNRVLVLVLLVSISIVTTAYYKVTQARLNDCESHSMKTDMVVDSLRREINSRTDAENTRLIKRVAWQDSVKQVLQDIIDKQKR